MKMTRRELLAGAAASSLALIPRKGIAKSPATDPPPPTPSLTEEGSSSPGGRIEQGRPSPNGRLKIALITGIMFKYAHSQHFADRFLEGYGWNGAWHKPPMDLVSLYVDQVGADDLSRERAARFPSIAMDFHALEALQCMVERRKEGETGVQAVQMIEGEAVWRAGEAGRWLKAMLSSALSRSDTPLGLTLVDGRTQDLVESGELPRRVKNPAAIS